MPIANDMKHIAEGIEVSYGERAAFVSDLSKGTNETLKNFHREHQQISADLGDFLTANRDNRQKVVASLLGKNKRELKAMAEKLANNLRESTSATKKDTAALMRQIREFIDLVEKENSELKKKTGNLLSAFHASHEAMAKDLRKSLSSEIKRQAGKVKEMRNSNRSDQRQARGHWQNLARIMFAKRAGKDEEPKEKIAEAKTKIDDVVSAVKLKEQMMRLISAATSGVSLSRMGKTLGIPYIRLAKPASELVKQGEIKKQDSEYFRA